MMETQMPAQEINQVPAEDRRPVIIQTIGLRKTYFTKIAIPVLHGIDMTVRAGEFIAIIGQSGSGKSTLLNILGALDVPTSGTVLINGTDISQLEEDELADLRSITTGFVFQFHFLQDEFTCLENACMPITIRNGAPTQEERERITVLLERVNLGHRLNSHPDEMSGGENQRCAIVRALANEPRIVLADEPTGNLDSHSGAEVFALMREMNLETGVAFVMVTHDDRLAQAADRILMIQDGIMHEVDKEEHRIRTHGVR